MREGIDSNFFDLQAMLLSKLAQCASLVEAQKLLLQHVARAARAAFAVLYRLDSAAGQAAPVCVHGTPARSPEAWALEGEEAGRFLNAVVVHPDRKVKLLEKDSREGANLVFGEDESGQPVWVMRLEWSAVNGGREAEMKYYRKMCRPVGPTLKLLEDKESSERLAKDLSELQEAASVVEDELDDLDVDRLLGKLLKVVQGQTEARNVCVLLADAEGLQLRPRAYVGDLVLDAKSLPRTLRRREKGSKGASERRSRPGATGTFFVAFDSARTYFCPDVAKDEAHTPLFRGARASLAVPLLVGSRAIGVILLETEASRPFSADEARAIESLARTAAVYLTKARVCAETEADGAGPPLDLLGQPRAVIENAAVAAESDAPVLIEGESGTGKSVLARYIHRLGGRRKGTFVALNCGTISDSLLLSQLFGHVKGAFTGADQNVEGALGTADGGTLFLDDVQVLSKEAQSRFLQSIETGTFTPVGSTAPRKVDVRVIASSNVPLQELVKKEQFREDLYYRLAVLPIRTSPLRLLKRLLPRLIDHKLRLVARRERKGMAPAVAPAAMALLRRHSWPGNYRELENVLRSLVVKDVDGVIDIGDLPAQFQLLGRVDDRAMADSYREANEHFEKTYLQKLLKESDGNIAAAARQSGLSRPHLYRLLEKHGIAPKKG